MLLWEGNILDSIYKSLAPADAEFVNVFLWEIAEKHSNKVSNASVSRNQTFNDIEFLIRRVQNFFLSSKRVQTDKY